MPIWYLHLPSMVFIFALGAAVGSFINVVIYRLPRGMSVTIPPSRCPICGARLQFFSENLPILGWLFVRGKCRYCKAKISPQYMLVELFMAMLFLGLYVLFYVVNPQTPWLGSIGMDWWHTPWTNGFFRTWPLFIAMTFMLAGLLAMTVIDAKTFTIPIQIPLFITFAGFLAHGLQGMMPLHPHHPDLWLIPVTDWQWFAIACGGVLGIGVGVILLKTGALRYSFADYHEYVEEDAVLGDYPHARREMSLEVAFLVPCMLGLVGGWLLGSQLPTGAPPVVVQALGGSFLGYLVGGGIVWLLRIVGTIAFGREAMGMGDVHLLAAVGAVLGCVDPIFIFFVAPFFGLLWAAMSMGLASVFKTARRELPYGPHLALATLVVILGRPFFDGVRETYLPFLPGPGLWQ